MAINFSETNDMEEIPESLKLIIQTYDSETTKHLQHLEFQAITSLNNLVYRLVTSEQLAGIFLHLNQALPEKSQFHSRFILTRVPLDPYSLLTEFMYAQPLSIVTKSLKHNWFFQVLANQKLFFEYQPIFDFLSGDVFAYECLARAIDEQGKLRSGKDLIEAAIFTRCTAEFDELARDACIRSLQEIHNHQIFFINVLPNAIVHSPQTLEYNFSQIEKAGILPSQIAFELTEVEMLAHTSELPRLIEQMRERGFRIAVDDLCSCVSLNHYFVQFHPDIIKLDRQITHQCSQHSLQQVLIKSLVNSAHDLGIVVLAEGLEEPEDIAFCREVGVDLGQGFGLARPQKALQNQALPCVSND